MTFAARLERLKGLAILPDKPEETPDSTLRALWCAAGGTPLSVEAAASHVVPDLTGAQFSTLDEMIARRLSGTPLAHLTGRQRFMGVELLAGPEALVPRKETELLGRTALDKLPADAAMIVDLCTGSGNLACALAAARPEVRLVAADLSVAAIELARRNAVFAGVAGRTQFFEGDLFAALPEDAKGQGDLLVCNPPYISSAKVDQMAEEISAHEPRLAFDGGGFGLGVVARLIAEAPGWLKPGAWLCFEIGKGQGVFLQRSLAKANAYDAIEPVADEAGEIRVLAARKGS